ncbi:hypothetical protein GOODEAATRI_027649 [Goodea atripinnis]|uniref:Uncharacterized protein n=1 Tax=Goodea atripinnis TaxID=208336 RepID=A0ABV0Q2H0_9TELE
MFSCLPLWATFNSTLTFKETGATKASLHLTRLWSCLTDNPEEKLGQNIRELSPGERKMTINMAHRVKEAGGGCLEKSAHNLLVMKLTKKQVPLQFVFFRCFSDFCLHTFKHTHSNIKL